MHRAMKRAEVTVLMVLKGTGKYEVCSFVLIVDDFFETWVGYRLGEEIVCAAWGGSKTGHSHFTMTDFDWCWDVDCALVKLHRIHEVQCAITLIHVLHCHQ